MPSRREFLRDAWVTTCAMLLSGGLGRALADAGPAPVAADAAREARFYKRLAGLQVQCMLCPRRCLIGPGRRGFCGTRENRSGILRSLVYGRPCVRTVNPIEKEPLFHYLPGSTDLSVGTAGCNLTCKYCLNWQITQSRPEHVESWDETPEAVAERLAGSGASTLVFTYNDPVVCYEYVYDCAVAARERGFGTALITAGYIEEKPLREVCTVVSAVTLGLKGFTQQYYHGVCGGELGPVKHSLEVLKDSGVWYEIVTLIVPTLNDSDEEIDRLTSWVAGTLGTHVPIHFTRFHPTYQLQELPPTPVATVERAVEIARGNGIKFAYVGNVFGHRDESTYCPDCGELLIKRIGYVVVRNELRAGKCPKCGCRIPGVWTDPATAVG